MGVRLERPLWKQAVAGNQLEGGGGPRAALSFLWKGTPKTRGPRETSGVTTPPKQKQVLWLNPIGWGGPGSSTESSRDGETMLTKIHQRKSKELTHFKLGLTREGGRGQKMRSQLQA